jgi:hypothetical protein
MASFEEFTCTNFCDGRMRQRQEAETQSSIMAVQSLQSIQTNPFIMKYGYIKHIYIYNLSPSTYIMSAYIEV